MQTFLPYASFEESAKCLDNKRLGKQRVECLQILNTLQKTSASPYFCEDCKKVIFQEFEGICPFCLTMWKKVAWQNHPAVQMWKGYENSLIRYALWICAEWKKRGFKDSCGLKISDFLDKYPYTEKNPDWLGNEEFHASHRAALLFKNPDYYKQFKWIERPEIKYIWPIKK